LLKLKTFLLLAVRYPYTYLTRTALARNQLRSFDASLLCVLCVPVC